MGQININNEIYGSNKSEDIIYNDITVKEKLDTIPVFDINDNSNVTNEINDNLTYSHIYDGLTSEENNKVLSANQGRVLNEKIESCIISHGDDVREIEANLDLANENITTLTNWQNKFLNTFYPVGSVYVTQTNKAPTFGGTWTLYDKQYKTQKITAKVTQKNTSAAAAYAYLSGHDVYIYFTFTPSVTLNDTTVEVFTITPSSVGVSQLGDVTRYFSAFSDGGQAVFSYQVTNAGKISITDVLQRATSTSVDNAVDAGTSVGHFNFLIKLNNINYMVDSFCDKFFWKRTA